LLEEAQARGLLELGRDEKSGTYVYRSSSAAADSGTAVEASPPVPALLEIVPSSVPPNGTTSLDETHQRRKSRRKTVEKKADLLPAIPVPETETAQAAGNPADQAVSEKPGIKGRKKPAARRPRKPEIGTDKIDKKPD
jgi:hypothetical protein